MKVSKFLLALGAVAAVLVATAAPADAAFRMRIEDINAGVGTVVTDNALPGDINPLSDVILFSGTVGAFTISVQVGTASPGAAFAGYWDAIDLNSVTVTTTGGGTLRIILEKDGFNTAPDGVVSLQSSVGGVNNGPVGSTAAFRSWANSANLVPAQGADQPVGAIAPIVFPPPPAGSTAAGPPGSPFGPGAFSGAGSAPIVKSGPYSLFSQAVITLTGPGSVTFDHTTGTNPAPAGLALLASGLPCLALRFLRRNKAAASA
jgi:hypothetical protein